MRARFHVAPAVLLLALTLAGASGCNSILGPGGSVTATLGEDGILVSNGTDRPIYWAAFDRDALALLLWAPCTEPATCPRIGSGRTVLISFDAVGVWGPTSREAVFYWWHLVRDGEGGYEPDEIRSIVLSG